MSRVARAGRYVSASFLGLILMAALAPSAFAQFGAQVSTAGVFTAPYPADWQRLTTSFTTMQVFNGTQEPVTADIKVTIFRDGQQVGTTPNIQRQYPDGNSIVATPDLTFWPSLSFTGKVGEAVETTGRLPDGFYTVCIDITNVRGQFTGAQYNTVSSCANFATFYPKPPQLIEPRNGSVVSSTAPVFQWSPILSGILGQLPHFFRLVEVYPGQTPERAIEANRAIYEDEFGFNMPGGNRSSFSYPASAPHFIDGHRYAWRIQAVFGTSGSRGGGLSTNNNLSTKAQAPGQALIQYNLRPIGENEGRSQVYTFIWKADPLAKTGDVPSNLPAAEDTRMGNVWSPPSGQVGRYSEVPGARYGNGAEADGRGSEAGVVHGPSSGSSENFADRLARAMASMWKQGPAAAVRVARGSLRSETNLRSETDPRIARAPSGSIGNKNVTPPAPPPADSSPADTTGAAEAVEGGATDPAATDPSAQAVVTPAQPPVQPGTVPSTGVGPDWARLHGTASLNGETYSRSGSGDPTRPFQSSRVVTGLSVGILKDQMRIPVSALVSDDQVAFRQNINQVAVAPRFHWAGLTAGNFSPQFSSYTLSDATILGGGLELAPKQWHLGFVSGRARKALAPTLEGIVTPQFERNMTAGRIGYGNPLANSIEFSILHATDDASSIAGAESTLTITPEGNTVYSIKASGVMPSKHLRAQVETALSRYERDRDADAPSVDGQALGLQLFHETAMTRLGVKAEYLNGGFMTLGNSSITGDRIDLGLNARVQLLQGKLAVDGMAGLRNDAVGQALAAETQRRSYGLSGSWQPNAHFGADAQWSLYTNEAGTSDSLFTGNVNATRAFTLSPRTSWVMGRMMNSFTCSASIQKSANGGALTDTKSLSLLGNYSAQVGGPFSVNLTGSYIKTDFEIAVSEQSAFGPGFTLASFRSKVLTNAQLQLTRSRTGNAGTDTDITPRVEMRWDFANRQALILRGNFRRFHYAGDAVPQFNERIASLEYVTNL